MNFDQLQGVQVPVCQAELSKLRAQLGHTLVRIPAAVTTDTPLVRIPAAVTMDTPSGENPSSCNHGYTLW